MSETLRKKQPFQWRYLAPAGLVLAVVVWGVSYFRAPPTLPKDIRHIVLISIDTLRADHLSCYGYSRQTTPNIDAVAKEAVLFEHVVSPIPTTLPSHSSMLTGTTPLYHGVHYNIDNRLEASNLTLAEILAQNGYTTGAIISSFVLDSQFGLDQGFDTYNDRFIRPIAHAYINQRIADEATEFACDWLEKHQSEPFFLFLHYYDPHHKYIPPEPFATIFKDNLYAGEIAYTDYCIGQVLTKLKELGLHDSTLLIITSDHGEGLGEHTEESHGYFIYQSTIRVPLIIRVPGGPKGKKVPDAVGLVDIVPTVCGLLGIDPPPVVHGKDLSPLLKKRGKVEKKERHIYCESLQATQYGCSPLLGVVADRWKYIHAPRPELYELDKDPHEGKNLMDEHPKRAQLLKNHLELIVQEQAQTRPSDDKFVLDNESRRRLESLGYIGGGPAADNVDLDASKEDPKDRIRLYQQVLAVQGFIEERQYSDAETVCRQILAEQPEYSVGYFFMGKISFEKNDTAESISYLSKFLSMIDQTISQDAQDSSNFFLRNCIHQAYHGLGINFAQMGKHYKALDHYAKALKIKADSPETYYYTGNSYLKLGQFSEAVEQYDKALVLDPSLSEAHYALGITLSEMGKFAEAVSHYKEALQLKPGWPEAFSQMARVKALYENEDCHDPNEAVQLAQQACKLTDYKDPGMLDTLAIAFAAAKRFPDAVQTAQKALHMSQMANQEKLADEIKKRLELYKVGRPYYESPKSLEQQSP